MWCVDGISKFVLKVGPTSFYRIELPAESPDEKEKVEEFKCAVAKLLQFERTPSPFVTGQLHFDEPITPARRKSLQPRDRAKRWRLNKVWEPEDAEHRARLRSRGEKAVLESEARRRGSHTEGVDFHESDGVGSSTGSEEQDNNDGASSASEVEAGLDREDPQPNRDDTLPTNAHIQQGASRPFQIARQIFASRSMTAPVPIALSGRRALALETSPNNSHPQESDAISIASSHDSFHSGEELAKSPTETASFMSSRQTQEEAPAQDDIVEQFSGPKESGHSRHTSKTVSTPNTPRPFRRPGTAERSEPSTPTLIGDSGDDGHDHPWADVLTPPDSIHLRRLHRRLSGASQRPALDPLPHPVNLFSPPRTPPRMSTALIRKTYSVLMGPPAHLVALMLRIAARIVQGLPIVYAPSLPHSPRRKMAGAWESSADEEDEWDEDDYGIPLGNIPRGSHVSRSEQFGSDWGVD